MPGLSDVFPFAVTSTRKMLYGCQVALVLSVEYLLEIFWAKAGISGTFARLDQQGNGTIISWFPGILKAISF